MVTSGLARSLGAVLSSALCAVLLLASAAQAQAPDRRKHPVQRAAPASRPAAPVQRPAPPPRPAAVAPRSFSPPPRLAAPPRPAPAIRQAPVVRQMPYRAAPRTAQPQRIAPQRNVSRPDFRRAISRDLRRADPPRRTLAAPNRLERRLQSRQQITRQQRLRRQDVQRQGIQRQDVQRQAVQQRVRTRAERSRDLRREQVTRRREDRELRRLPPRQRAARRQQIEQQRQQRAVQRRQLLQSPRAVQTLTAQPSRRAANAAARRNRQVVTPQRAIAGRFGTRFRRDRDPAARVQRFAARHAWRRGLRASFVAWTGALFWPYAYADVFDYTFWPEAYDDGFWAYAYDDFFDGIYWPAGSPYAGYAEAAPYAGDVTGSLPGRRITPQIRTQQRTAKELCDDPAKGITAWPIDDIAKAVQPDEAQKVLLDALRDAAARAAAGFKGTCANDAPLTPLGRLKAMRLRLAAMLQAVQAVRGPLEQFYGSLSDEQKARFNAVGPKLDITTGRNQTPARDASAGPACSEAKPGLADLPMDRIADVVQPTEAQNAAFDALAKASEDAVSRLQAACPEDVPQTPVGRLEAMQKRLEAMLAAADTIEPVLGDFYASLSNEQKARFNSMRAGGATN